MGKNAFPPIDDGDADVFPGSPPGGTIFYNGVVIRPLVAVIMGSTSDWETMRHAAQVLADFGVPHEKKVVSAHRTPKLLASFADRAEARGLEVIIAGAGGAARRVPAG